MCIVAGDSRRIVCAGLIAVLLATLSNGAVALLAMNASRYKHTMDDVRVLSERYGISVEPAVATFDIALQSARLTGNPPTAENLRSYVSIFVSEFQAYPPTFIAAIGMTGVVLCERLAVSGVPVAAAPDFGNATLYLDVARGSYSPQYQRTVLHHELFHLVDYATDCTLIDPDWASLNYSDFTYGSGGWHAQADSRASLFDPSLTGFVTRYSKSGVEEDKAELYAHLIVNTDEVEQAAIHDPVLQRKIDAMQAFLAGITPEMDVRLWKSVRNDGFGWHVARRILITTVALWVVIALAQCTARAALTGRGGASEIDTQGTAPPRSPAVGERTGNSLDFPP